MSIYKATYNFTRLCDICKNPFQVVWPNHSRRTCSPECKLAMRREIGRNNYHKRLNQPIPPPKPLVELTEAQCGYIAGIIDGEGWIGITARTQSWKKAEKPHYHRPMVSVGQSKRPVVDFLGDLLGHKDIGITREHKTRQPLHWTIRFHPPCLRWLLPQLLPHLVLKRRQAEILIEFMGLCRYHGTQVSDEEWQHRERLREEIRDLNRKPGAGRWHSRRPVLNSK